MAILHTIFAVHLLLFIGSCCCRIHKLDIKNDERKYIALSTFGFYKEGILDVKLSMFKGTPQIKETDIYGFSVDRTMNDAMNPYLDIHQEHCLLESPVLQSSSADAVLLTLDLKSRQLRVNCSKQLRYLHIYKNRSSIPPLRLKRDSLSDQSLMLTRRKRDQQEKEQKMTVPGEQSSCADLQIPIVYDKNRGVYNTSFVIYVATEAEEGLYNLYFHSCPNYGSSPVSLDFTMEIEENNKGNYLSAGEMPLPALYTMMSILFFLSGCFWVFILVKSKHPVYKIHYLMAVLVYLKSLSLMFHSINYHFIQIRGEHVAAWAILYYITHLLKGSVLFITIVLIGTGWTFIKHILSDKDKKIFMIVIPLQVLANVAKIIIEESEEGDVEHKTWLDVFMLVDLLCCGAILFPVVWSIRHLQEASHTDGKAAINLRKLKLFRHFYVMIVCYIYFTRIIVYLLQMTVSFQYEWLDEMFREMVTYVFFVMTGYKFRPASANPYFQVTNEDEEDPDDEMDVVVSQCGVKEGLSKLSRVTTLEATHEEKDLLINKRESSHEYD
ncbi:protein GPR107 [Macrosteles quadrilineatus]|uniref:protein GPR107 n=1 Tax=Macrosteles quadrilineatus TaxID=74068 RepID=UPI0023E1D573|nr:protein GPR107 [Macrosteles quadrilineatus]